MYYVSSITPASRPHPCKLVRNIILKGTGCWADVIPASEIKDWNSKLPCKLQKKLLGLHFVTKWSHYLVKR